MEAVAKNTRSENFKNGITFQNIDEHILLPMNYGKSTTGLYNRAYYVFAHFLNHWMGVPEDKLAMIRDIIPDLLGFTAVDDICDYTTMRQRIPTTHKIFGIAKTVNAFDFLILGTLEKFLKFKHPMALGIHLDTLLGTYAGEGLEIYWRENSICPTEEEYAHMAINKSGSWFLLVGRLMNLFGSTHKDTERFIKVMGLYTQIRDDYNCLTNPKHFASKGFCDDITEGKFSFPIVHAINSHPEEKQNIIRILQQHTKDVELKKQCLSILEKCGSFEYTLTKLQKLKLIMFEEMNKLGENPYFESLIKLLSETH